MPSGVTRSFRLEMELPLDQIGPTDVIAYRECPRRMSYGMRRHTGKGTQNHSAMTPESDERGAVWARYYGSAIHEAIRSMGAGNGIGRAIQDAWNEWGNRLEPGDLDLLHADLETYQTRDFPQTRLLLNEEELRVPLMEFRGRTIYVRSRVDRLYERIDAPGTFIHVDYKSSRHPKSEKDVREDLQLWISNWLIHEAYPECETLLQYYDQLRYGQIPTRKTADARRRIHDWLIAQVTAILEDDGTQADGLLAPKKNEWCAWCPILESCPVVPELTEFSLMEINALAPATKVGRKTIVDLDPGLLPEYLYRLENAEQAQKVLDRFIEAVRRILKDMPSEEREQLGYRLKPRSSTKFTPRSLEALHAKLGEAFYDVASVTQTGLKDSLADDPDLLSWALSLGEKVAGSDLLVKD